MNGENITTSVFISCGDRAATVAERALQAVCDGSGRAETATRMLDVGVYTLLPGDHAGYLPESGIPAWVVVYDLTQAFPADLAREFTSEPVRAAAARSTHEIRVVTDEGDAVVDRVMSAFAGSVATKFVRTPL